jgi:hypothetical protein
VVTEGVRPLLEYLCCRTWQVLGKYIMELRENKKMEMKYEIWEKNSGKMEKNKMLMNYENELENGNELWKKCGNELWKCGNVGIRKMN